MEHLLQCDIGIMACEVDAMCGSTSTSNLAVDSVCFCSLYVWSYRLIVHCLQQHDHSLICHEAEVGFTATLSASSMDRSDSVADNVCLYSREI